MDIDISPIDIELDDIKSFAQVAFLVDKKEFLVGLNKLRKKYQLDTPLERNVESIRKHFLMLVGADTLKHNPIPNPNPKGLTYLLSHPDRLLDYLIEHNDIPSNLKLDEKVKTLQKDFFNAIKTIRRNLYYPPMFDSVILQATLFHCVFVFNTAYPHIFNEPPHAYESEADEGIKRNALMAIVVTPYTTEKDLKSAFSEIKTDFVQLIGTQYPAYTPMPKDTISNIKRDRVWYWKYVKTKSPKTIAIEENGGRDYYQEATQTVKHNVKKLSENDFKKYDRHLNHIDTESETIRKAVKRYKKHLNRHLDNG